MRNLLSMSWSGITSQVVILGAILVLSGCGNPAENAVKSLYQPSPDKDVTTDPSYNFAPFTNTVWKTKTKTAIVDEKRYTGTPEVYLTPPMYFDPTDPKYTPQTRYEDSCYIVPRRSPPRLTIDEGSRSGGFRSGGSRSLGRNKCSKGCLSEWFFLCRKCVVQRTNLQYKLGCKP